MSRSENLIPITAVSQPDYTGVADPVEIHLIDGDFNRIAQSVGKLEAEVEPGVYKLKLRAGESFREEALIVRPDSGPVNVELEPLEFQSATPLYDTETSREYHQEHSVRLSGEVHDELGDGSAMFVFVRDLDGRGRVSPATGLYLTDIDGEVLVDYGAAAEKSTRTHDESNLWAGYTVSLSPGSYRLRADTGEAGVVEQLVHVCGGWQTHVFLTRRPFGKGRMGRRPDLVTGSIHMSELDMSFAPYADGFRDGDLARKALAGRRTEAVPEDALRRLVNYKFQNPMLGLFGAYLLTEQESPPADLLSIVMGNMRSLLGAGHPDIVALDTRLSHLGLGGRAPEAVEIPPMVRLGWDAILDHTKLDPRLVPAESLAGRMADRIWGRGPWLVWQRPDEAVDETELLEEADLRAALADIGEVQAAMAPDAAQSSRLTPLEAGILDISQSLRDRKVTPPDISAGAVEALGVPPTVAAKAVKGLQIKLSKGL